MMASHYHIDCVWGLEGLKKFPNVSDVIVWVDALGNIPVTKKSFPPNKQNAQILTSGIHDAYAVGDWIVNLQLSRNQRLHVLIVCADAENHSIADQLAAGAVVERLASQGIDAMSPEAAVANKAFIGLSNAVEHLITASAAAHGQSMNHEVLTIDENLPQSEVRILN